jgi:hypothetical protein
VEAARTFQPQTGALTLFARPDYPRAHSQPPNADTAKVRGGIERLKIQRVDDRKNAAASARGESR